MRQATAGCAAILLALCAVCARAAEEKLVRVVPEETDEILANPGMGWETFLETRKTDVNLPGWIPSTVRYERRGWGKFEPEPGRIDTAFVDELLKESRESGQKLAFRVMCCSPTRGVLYHPKWLKEVGGRELECDYEGGAPLPIPDFDDAVVLGRHLDFIRRLGKRYDGHADLDHVDVGSIGWWGEWHMSGSRRCKMPSAGNLKKVVETYLGAFKKTPLLMNLDGRESARLAFENGAGWRADCLGDLGMFAGDWSHMKDGYPKRIGEARLENHWRKAPIALESCGDVRTWVNRGWSLRYVFNYALALHASYFNNKSAPLPEEANVRAEVERFLRRLGYRLVLKELTHPAQARAGGALELAMKWQNGGSAPCYAPYRVAYRLSGEDGVERVLVGKVTVETWMPGAMELFTEAFFRGPGDLPGGEIYQVKDAVELPGDLPAGVYTLAVGVVGKEGRPVARLGIKGRGSDGWYAVSRVRVIR
jgi:Domain of unknown function (DUF4832)